MTKTVFKVVIDVALYPLAKSFLETLPGSCCGGKGGKEGKIVCGGEGRKEKVCGGKKVKEEI